MNFEKSQHVFQRFSYKAIIFMTRKGRGKAERAEPLIERGSKWIGELSNFEHFGLKKIAGQDII